MKSKTLPRIWSRPEAITLLSLAFAIGQPQTLKAADSPLDYATVAIANLIERATQVSQSLSKAGLIPGDNISHPMVQLEGKSAQPSATIAFDACEFRFMFGAIISIRRPDLFKDRGPDSLILRHLTNQVLTLKTADAPARALAVLHCVGMDTNAIQKAYRITARDDLMDAYPVRNGGPNFPKDLHFFGELISREKIRIVVEFQPLDPTSKPLDFAADTRVEFLATTGELLEAFLINLNVASPLSIPIRDRVTIAAASDFTPVSFVSGSSKLSEFTGSSDNPPLAVLNAAWQHVQGELGNRKPVCYLLVDNLNKPQAIAAKMNQLAGGVPWTGLSRVWNHELPFDRERLKRLARDGQGLEILALYGNVQIQLDEVSDATASDFGNRLKLPVDVPDHAVFLFKSGGNISSFKMAAQLESGLRGKAQVFDEAQESPWQLFGSGFSYVNGQVRSNSLVAITLSGFLPGKLEQRQVSWEVNRPFGELAASFGPSPLQKFVDCLGENAIRILQQADRVEVFRLKGEALEPPGPASPGSAIGDQTITGHGKTQRSDFAQHLANAILDEKNNFGVVKACIWSPIIGFRAWHGKEAVIVIICFQCNSLTIQFQDTDGKLGGTIGMDFDSNQGAFIRLAQQALPADATLKSLNPNE
jgi:hypothetical protein